jgi:mRNA interferase RelE/StbE
VIWNVEFVESARKELRGLFSAVQDRIFDYLIKRPASIDNPYILGVPLAGSKVRYGRFRVGDYRIIFRLDKENRTIIIMAIGHRREVYRE